MEARRCELRLGEQALGRLVSGLPPHLQIGELVKHSVHHGLEAIELLREVFHGIHHLRFEPGWFLRCQDEIATIWEKILGGLVVERL